METSKTYAKTISHISGNSYKEIEIRDSSVAEHEESMELMASHFKDQENGKVGIFWFDRVDRVLFGVVAVDKNDFEKPNVGGGLITCSQLHYKVWQKGFNKQKFKQNGKGPFVGDYKDTPRGRVFYNPTTDTFEIKVGSWIDQNPDALDEIIDEFDLYNSKYVVIKDYHWDIGNGWENL